MIRLTRRQLLQYGVSGGAGLVVFGRLDVRNAFAISAAAAQSTLAPTSIAKYQLPLVIPPAMPRTRLGCES